MEPKKWPVYWPPVTLPCDALLRMKTQRRKSTVPSATTGPLSEKVSSGLAWVPLTCRPHQALACQ